MVRTDICLLALALVLPVDAVTCGEYTCVTTGSGKKDGVSAVEDATEAKCCAPVDFPAAGGTCGDPNPNAGGNVDFVCPAGTTSLTKPFGDCTSVEECEANCCTLPAVVTITETILTSTTITAFDLSSGSSGDSLDSSASDSMNDHDFSNSGKSSGVHTSGSSGYNLPLWLWALAAAFLCCCCLAGAALAKPAKKKKKAVKKVPPPPAPVFESEPLLPTLVPTPTTTASYVPVTTAAPAVSYSVAAPTYSVAAPTMTTGYAQPTYSYAQPTLQPAAGRVI